MSYHWTICEWNPDDGRFSMTTDPVHEFAMYYVGAGKRSMQLCAKCAALPQFGRLKKKLMPLPDRATLMMMTVAQRRQFIEHGVDVSILAADRAGAGSAGEG